MSANGYPSSRELARAEALLAPPSRVEAGALVGLVEMLAAESSGASAIVADALAEQTGAQIELPEGAEAALESLLIRAPLDRRGYQLLAVDLACAALARRRDRLSWPRCAEALELRRRMASGHRGRGISEAVAAARASARDGWSLAVISAVGKLTGEPRPAALKMLRTVLTAPADARDPEQRRSQRRDVVRVLLRVLARAVDARG